MRQFRGIDCDAALRAAVGQICERAFPAHPHRQCGRLPHRQRRGETSSAFGRTERDVMLNAITLEGFRAPVIHMHGKSHGDSALGICRPLPIVLVDVQVIGNDPKLLARHRKNFVVVNCHRSVISKIRRKRRFSICAELIEPSNQNAR